MKKPAVTVRFVGVLVALGLMALTPLVATGPASADGAPAGCADDPFAYYTPTGPALARVCVAQPVAGPVSGTITVTATLTNIGEPTFPRSQFAARRMEFTLDGLTLLTDYQAEPKVSVADPAVYTFQLSTDRWVDGIHVLRAHAVMGDTLKGPYPAQTPAPGRVTVDAVASLTFVNGITVVPPNTNTFTPSTGSRPGPGAPFVLAATGDAAGGEPEADAVIEQIASWNPNLFLYLGDVYESGTFTEFQNWYGMGGQRWSRFRAITNPTVGNHEYDNGVAPGYFDYWNNVPDYYSFNANGWHFVSLNSNDPVGQQPGSPQYEWLKSDLATSAAACTVAYFHHPLFNVGAQGSTVRMSALWQLMATSGVDLALTGHDHNYQRWQALDGVGNPDPMGLTEFVAGAGGHGVRPFTTTDPRLVVGFDTTPAALGSLKFELADDRATFAYVNSAGATLDSGQVLCERSPYAPDSPRHEIYVARAALQRLLAAGVTPQATLTSAIGHLNKAQADAKWVSDWSPIAIGGEVVLDEMKRAVGDLKSMAGASPVVPSTMTELSLAGRGMAQAAIIEATAAYGALDAVTQARSLLADGMQRASAGDLVGALDKFKQSFKAGRDALVGAPDAWTPGVGARGRIGAELAALYTLYPTVVSSDQKGIKGAVAELGKALDLALWRSDFAPRVKDVFDRLKAAGDQLSSVAGYDVWSDQLTIVAVARGLATDAIDAAIARGGSPSKITTARAKLAEAEVKVTQGKYKEAMDRFRDSWLSATSA